MLAYAAPNRTAGRAGSPKALILIIAGHAALIGAVMAAKMEVVSIAPSDPIDVHNVPLDPPPPSPPVRHAPAKSKAPTPSLDRTDPIVKVPADPGIAIDPGPPIADPGPGPIIDQVPPPTIKPVHTPVRVGLRFNTPDSLLRPPYPASKQRDGEEATLRLRLSIDARGRVTAVDPVGPADPAFLEAARRHLIRSWRYKPATEDGVAIPSSTLITLSFRLDDA